MNRIGEKCRPVPFNNVAKRSQAERRRNQQQANNPVEPNDNNRGEANRDSNEMQRAVHRMGVRTVVMVDETQRSPPRVAGL